MENKQLEIKTAIQISKPASEVFAAIADHSRMSGYFIAWASGPLVEGTEVLWQFPEFEMKFPVRVARVESDKYLSFYWESDGKYLLVEIALNPITPDSTVVNITEGSRPCDEAGIQWLQGNAAGWANFLACLKAYLEYGINLRSGAFDFMSDK